MLSLRSPVPECGSSLALLLVLASTGAAAAAAVLPGDDLAVVRSRLYASAMAECTGGDTKGLCAEASTLAGTLRPDGSWADVNYTDNGRSVWKTAVHWTRLQTMGVALRCAACATATTATTTPMTSPTDMLAKIKRALQFWTENDFLDPNWWYNDFGVPMSVAPFGIVLAGASCVGRERARSRAAWQSRRGDGRHPPRAAGALRRVCCEVRVF